MRDILHICCQIQRTSDGLRYVTSGPCQIICNCTFVYLGISIQLNVSPLPMVICRQFDARYFPHLLSNTAHVLLFMQCQLWTRSNTMLLQFCIFRPQYSFERISAAIGDMTTIRCGLYSTIAAKCSKHHPVCAFLILGAAESSIIAALQILS
jgi:hypothetical protein